MCREGDCAGPRGGIVEEAEGREEEEGVEGLGGGAGREGGWEGRREGGREGGKGGKEESEDWWMRL